MAGAVYLNDALLWRDASLTAPLSHSWNMPRWWPLPANALQNERNTLWVHVVGVAELTPGLDLPKLGDARAIEAEHADLLWRQRTAFTLSAAVTAAMAAMFFVMWCMRRQERAFGWFALMNLCWVLYLSSMLATAPWPLWRIDSTPDNLFRDSLAMARLNLVAMVLYTLCFCIFTFRFAEQTLPRSERALKALAGVAIAALVVVQREWQEDVSKLVLLGCALVFMGNCLQLQWHAWRTRQRDHLLLALCWAIFLMVGIHDVGIVLQEWQAHQSLTPLTSLITAIFMAVLLGSRLASSMRKGELLIETQEQSLALMREDLKQALAREHSQTLEHARLQERMQLAHDLHDGLGGSLVRSIAVVERAQRTQQPVENERMLSLLKLLRNDLRQIIDYGSVAAAPIPDSPEQWLAPLRHRFSKIFDELEIAWEWQLDSSWRSERCQPSALQCLNMERIVEEALSNALKHSQASRIRVICQQSVGDDSLVLVIEDDGIGFDPDAAQKAGSMHVGLRSMAARAQNSGALLEVKSTPGKGTQILVQVCWDTSPAAPPHALVTPISPPKSMSE